MAVSREEKCCLIVMEKSPVISKARALGLARALKLITRAFPGFANRIDFTNVTDLISLYKVQYTIIKCSKSIDISLVFNIVICKS